jgi:dCMP deaminase
MTDWNFTRPPWQDWFMELAFVTAKRGSCRRKQVGAIIVRDRDRAIVGGGYNGAPAGMPDCLEVGCEMRMIGEKESCVRTIHAESNALDRAGPLNEPHTMYCTVIPCRDCALRIIQNGWIKKVIYAEYYESRSSKDTEMLFANRDPAFLDLMTKRYGPSEETGWIPTARVELVKMDFVAS